MGKLVGNAMGKGLTPLAVSPHSEPGTAILRIGVAGPDKAVTPAFRVREEAQCNRLRRKCFHTSGRISALVGAVLRAAVIQQLVGGRAEFIATGLAPGENGVAVVKPVVLFEVAVRAEQANPLGVSLNLEKNGVSVRTPLFASVDVVEVQRRKAAVVSAFLTSPTKGINKRLLSLQGILSFHSTLRLRTNRFENSGTIPLFIH